MSYPFWANNQAYNVGDIVNSDPPAANGAFVLRCKVAGTSAGDVEDQPLFSSILFETVTDNTVTWETVSAVYDEFYKLEPDAVIELFHLQFTAATNGLDDNLYFHANPNTPNTCLLYTSDAADE